MTQLTSKRLRGNVAREQRLRKAQFNAALILAGLEQQQWARRNKVTPQHLSLVLNGHRESRRLMEKVDRFVLEAARKFGGGKSAA